MGLRYALENGLMEIKDSPHPVFFDDTLDNSKELGIDNGAVVLNTPSYLLP